MFFTSAKAARELGFRARPYARGTARCRRLVSPCGVPAMTALIVGVARLCRVWVYLLSGTRRLLAGGPARRDRRNRVGFGALAARGGGDPRARRGRRHRRESRVAAAAGLSRRVLGHRRRRSQHRRYRGGRAPRARLGARRPADAPRRAARLPTDGPASCGRSQHGIRHAESLADARRLSAADRCRHPARARQLRALVARATRDACVLAR